LDFWIGISIVICAVALLRWVQARSKQGVVVASRAEAIEDRLGEVERRLVDIQDIILSMDEKLERMDRSHCVS
jgi:hypothetical protein